MKTIVTHIQPDLDAITASWLIKRFLPQWQDAGLAFVSAGKTIDGNLPDENPNIIHVDTGLGQFDHHQTDKYTSATKLVFEFLTESNYIDSKVRQALERLVNYVNEIDHFAEAYFPDSTSDRYDFCLHQIIESLKNILKGDEKIVEMVFILLDAELQLLRNKVKAEDEIKKGLVFQSSWGKSLAMTSKYEEAIKLALKMHYSLVVRKNPDKGNIRIKTLPEKKYDLTPLYEKIKKADKNATWFLHVSKNMLLNGSSKNPNFIPSSLTLQRLIEIIKEI